MKKSLLLALFSLLAVTLPLQSQTVIAGAKSDTTPVWVVYLDSVYLFAGYPELDMRVEAQAGWVVRTINPSQVFEIFYDTDGRLLNGEVVLWYIPRRVRPNPFRQ